jgi:hypothetical protein
MSLNADNSYAERMRQLVARTASTFTAPLPSAVASSDQLSATMARMTYHIQRDTNPRNAIQPCCAVASCSAPAAVTGISTTIETENSIRITWEAAEGATSYEVTTPYEGTTVTMGPGPLEAVITFSGYFGDEVLVTVTAINSCGSTAAEPIDTGLPCFLAGSLVAMADGSAKPIEDVKVGDILVGAFGEHNPVLALHRPLLGTAMIADINREHKTTTHHPHVSADRRFYCGEPGTVSTHTYGRSHTVINAAGQHEERYLHGLAPERILPLCVGVELKTIEGSRMVREMTIYGMPPSTQLYNLVMGGSHTYHVDGYAVTGWPREDDFDYDTWVPRNMSVPRVV